MKNHTMGLSKAAEAKAVYENSYKGAREAIVRGYFNRKITQFRKSILDGPFISRCRTSFYNPSSKKPPRMQSISAS
ncbi:hypothetical protein ACE3MQ_08875 [Paenibacillus lentus]